MGGTSIPCPDPRRLISFADADSAATCLVAALGGYPCVQQVSANPIFPLNGGCGCGAVRFQVTSPFATANYCHCTRCQRRSGAAASANARPESGSFRLLSGASNLRIWRPDGGWEKVFCGDCGSAIFSRNPDDHELISIRMGAFDTDPGIRPSLRQFVAFSAPWEPIPDDGLPQHPARAQID